MVKYLKIFFSGAKRPTTSKLCTRHMLLEYCQVCLIDDHRLTLTYFTASSKLVPFVFVWNNALAVHFQETIEACEVKSGIYSQINEYIMIYDNIRPRSFIHTQIQHFETSLPQETPRSFEAKFPMELPWDVRMKIVQMFRVTLLRWLPGSYTVKT